MSALHKLNELASGVLNEYFELSRQANAAQEKETKACILIQASIRGYLTRLHLEQLQMLPHANAQLYCVHSMGQVLVIQRYWRGYLGRQRHLLFKDNHQRKLRKVYFDQQATIIQKWWRGYYSRKHVHNYYARKQYLQTISAKNNEIRQACEEEQQAAIAHQQQEADAAAKQQFAASIQKLHHLVSTAHIPSIFNSPYAHMTGTVATAAGKTIDDHLRGSMREQVQNKKKRLPPLSAPAKIGSSVEGGSGRSTLRQSTRYTLVKEAEILEDRVNRSQVLAHHGVPFVPIIKTADPYLPVQSVRNLEAYVDPWDPTVGNKTDRFDAKAMTISKAAFKKYLPKRDVFDDDLLA